MPYLPTREHQVAQDRRFLVARVRRPRAALATYRGLTALGALGLFTLLARAEADQQRLSCFTQEGLY